MEPPATSFRDWPPEGQWDREGFSGTRVNNGLSGRKGDMAFILTSCFSVGGPCQLVEPHALPAPCQAQLLPQRPRPQYAPLLLCFGEDPFCGGEQVLENGNPPAKSVLGEMLTMLSLWGRHWGLTPQLFGSCGSKWDAQD